VTTTAVPIVAHNGATAEERSGSNGLVARARSAVIIRPFEVLNACANSAKSRLVKFCAISFLDRIFYHPFFNPQNDT